METIASWQFPIKTASEANSSEHWTKKARRRKIQKGRVKTAMRTQPPSSELFIRRHDSSDITRCNVRVIVTRIAPRSLDCQDNLPMSLKGIVDAIAEELTGNYVPGRADDAEWISWEYRQERGKPKEYAVRIEIMHD